MMKEIQELGNEKIMEMVKKCKGFNDCDRDAMEFFINVKTSEIRDKYCCYYGISFPKYEDEIRIRISYEDTHTEYIMKNLEENSSEWEDELLEVIKVKIEFELLRWSLKNIE